MTATSVSVLVPLNGSCAELPDTLEAIERYLQSTGFAFDIRVVDSRDGAGPGAMLRRGALDAKESVVVIIDPDLPYPIGAIGNAVAMIESGSTDVVFGIREGHRDERRHMLLRWFLVPALPDPCVRLKAFSSDAARLLFAEGKQDGGAFDLELAYLANKYGFRVEPLTVSATHAPRMKTFGAISGLAGVTSIRMTDRNNGYRATRRCLVCFSSEVWTCAQIDGNIVRSCSRCKCRYLNQFANLDDTQPVRRVLRSHHPATDAERDRPSETAREKTSRRRLAILRRQLGSRARVLEIGVRDGSFGLATAREFEYVGIDASSPVARAARAKGLDVYCATLPNFVNTGPAFDAVTIDHVFENMADPHDALARIKDLLKPGGTLFLTTFDTEALVYLLSERRRVGHYFRTHLVLYSRSALIELLEHSGFEIASVGPDFQYRDQKFLRHVLGARSAFLASVASAFMRILPDPLLVGSGSIRIVARRRAGTPTNIRAIRSVEPTHAR
jgi:2-polyprenyl-3-methyl-5-hydroxy-6-metoxy-1,4-benzoquinol methylase